MQHRDPSPAAVTHVSRVLAELRMRTGLATSPRTAAPSRSPVPRVSPPSRSGRPQDPIGIGLAASSLMVPTAGAFFATEDEALGVLLVVLAWVPLMACCLEQVQARLRKGVSRSPRPGKRIAACPVPERSRAPARAAGGR